jgi:hypothetical protein
MEQILKSKVIVVSNSVDMNKKKRIKKPWWNDNLTYLVNDMCYAEKNMEKTRLLIVSVTLSTISSLQQKPLLRHT